MPTIDQLPGVSQAISGADELPISQLVGSNRVTTKTTLGAVMSLLAAAGLLPPGVIVSQGAPTSGQGEDGWGYINSSTGDVWQRASGTWTKTGSIKGPAGATGPAGPSYSLHALSTVTAMAATDLIGIVTGGVDATITLQNALNAETIDELTGAGGASDTDTFLVGQGSNVLVRQTLAALWTWVAGHIPGYKPPVQEIAASVTIDATYSGKILVVTASNVTITPNYGLMGSGFECEIVTTAGGSVVWGSGVVATNSGSGLAADSYAKLIGMTYSGGTMVLACVGSAASSGGTVTAPGTISGLTASAETSTSITYNWTAPTTGGTATFYLVQYRQNGTTTWNGWGPNPTSTTVTLTGLAASTAYDIQVAAGNSGGDSGYVQLLDTTTAVASYAPNAVTNLSAGSATSSSLTLTWTASATDSTHNAATSYTVSVNGGTAVNVGNVATYTASGLTSGTAYSFSVIAINATGSSSGVTASGTTSASGAGLLNGATGYLLSAGTSQGTPSPSYSISGTSNVPVNVNDNSVSTGSSTVPASVSFAWSTSGTTVPTTGLVAAAGSATGVNGSADHVWYQWMSPPTATGTYYLWAIAYNSAGTAVYAYVDSSPVTFTA